MYYNSFVVLSLYIVKHVTIVSSLNPEVLSTRIVTSKTLKQTNQPTVKHSAVVFQQEKSGLQDAISNPVSNTIRTLFTVPKKTHCQVWIPRSSGFYIKSFFS